MTSLKNNIGKVYQNRFDPQEQKKKEVLWKTLCKHFFQKYVPFNSSVLDIGAGFCEFINTIQCAEKIALDINPDTISYAAQDVRVVAEDVIDMRSIGDECIDVVFVSNFFEHLPDKDKFIKALQEINRVLRQGGKLMILQPNISVLHGRYWDFIDHYIPLSHRSIVEALSLTGFDLLEVRSRFLPYTTKSLLPSNSFLVRLYLLIRPIQLLLGKQAWVVGVKT
jgi:SAM-dependent methyltransferase